MSSDERDFIRSIKNPLTVLLTCALRAREKSGRSSECAARLDAVIECARHILSLIESRK